MLITTQRNVNKPRMIAKSNNPISIFFVMANANCLYVDGVFHISFYTYVCKYTHFNSMNASSIDGLKTTNIDYGFVLCYVFRCCSFRLQAKVLSKGPLRKIDKIIRALIWRKEEQSQTSGGNSLVNWKTVCRPRHLGGLGVMDLEGFSRALRLPCDQTDMILFRACTSITLGNGHKTLFWHANWISDGPLKVRAPELYKITSG